MNGKRKGEKNRAIASGSRKYLLVTGWEIGDWAANNQKAYGQKKRKKRAKSTVFERVGT